MVDILVTQKDISDAEQFLVQFQSERIPDASFEVGSAVRDILIKGFASMYAFLRGENNTVAARQSLLRIQEELTDADDISQAVDEVLSNWFVNRRGGKYATVPARLHFTQKRAQRIPLAAKFWRTTSLVFYVDSPTDPYIISESQLFPLFDSSGILIDYVVDVPLKAAKTGSTYRVSPGTFAKVEIAGGLPYFSYAENVEDATGGDDIESTESLITRASTAISVRNLVNNRSCDVTLSEQFPEISETMTVGMGEVEQIRDRRKEVASHLQLHVGGCYDTYVTTTLTQVEENLTIGGYFARPDGVVNAFRDPQLTYELGNTFTALNVQAGHVLYLRSGISGLPCGFVITSVSDHELLVSENTPFPVASDELDAVDNIVQYSIGWLSPGFSEVELTAGVYIRTAAVAVAPNDAVPWGTSRKIQQPGVVVLDGRPPQDIKWVEITDPPSANPLIDPSTGTLIFGTRTNLPPVEASEIGYSEYQVAVLNPEESQSMWAVNTVTVGYGVSLPNPPGVSNYGVFDGYNLRVVYDTLTDFSSIHDYTINRNNRVTNASHLIRARHPVWLEMSISYRLRPSATTTLDETSAINDVVNLVNGFDPSDDFDVSDIAAMLRTNYSVIGAVYPITLIYHLDAPDGQQVYYTTTDIVSIFPTSSNLVTVTNYTDIIPPQDLINRGITSLTDSADLLDYLTYLGVSDRTVQYRTTVGRVSFVLSA